jgi:hypothetical protein
MKNAYFVLDHVNSARRHLEFVRGDGGVDCRQVELLLAVAEDALGSAAGILQKRLADEEGVEVVW